MRGMRAHFVGFLALAFILLTSANASASAKLSKSQIPVIHLDLRACGPPSPGEDKPPSQYGFASECCSDDDLMFDASHTIPADTVGIVAIHVPIQRPLVEVTSDHKKANVILEFFRIDGSRFLKTQTVTDSTGTAKIAGIDFMNSRGAQGKTGYYWVIGYSIDECARTVFRLYR